MTTTVIGLGDIGKALAKHMVNGGENPIVTTRHFDDAKETANEIGAQVLSMDKAIEAADTIVFAIPMDAIKADFEKYKDKLAGKVLIDVSNPIAPDGNGRYHRLLPARVSASDHVRESLPKGAHYVKAMGTLLADTLDKSANHDPKVAMFYVTEDDKAEKEVERLIKLMGFTPLKAGDLTHAIDIEVGGQLHEKGGLEHNLPTINIAKDALEKASKF